MTGVEALLAAPLDPGVLGAPWLGAVARGAVGSRLLPAVSLARLLDIDAGTAVLAGRHAFARLLVLTEPEPLRGAQRSAVAFALPVEEALAFVAPERGAKAEEADAKP